VAGFFGNLSNYHSFGHNKFVPELSRDTFKTILYSNPMYKNQDAFYKEVVDTLYPQVEEEIFNEDKPYNQINFPDEGGITGYFSRSMTKEDLGRIKRFLASRDIDLLNTRAFKYGDKIVITIGSIDTYRCKKNMEFEGQMFDL